MKYTLRVIQLLTMPALAILMLMLLCIQVLIECAWKQVVVTK